MDIPGYFDEVNEDSYTTDNNESLKMYFDIAFIVDTPD